MTAIPTTSREPAIMEYLRTPDSRFEHLPDFPYEPHYLQNGSLRMAYIDEHTGTGVGSEEVFLCLHGEPTWSFLYRKMIPVLLNYITTTQQTPLSRRVIAPDWFGFGRSDKPREDATYDFDFHRNAVLHLISSLNLTNITLVVQDWGGLIGLSLPITNPSLFKRLIVMNTTIGQGFGGGGGKPQAVLDWIAYTSSTPDLDATDLMARLGHKLSADEQRAYNAPFPDNSYKGGVRRFPQMVMLKDNMPGVEVSKQSRHFFETTDDTFHSAADVVVVCGMQDPILAPQMKRLAQVFKHGCYYAEIEEASHFVQEWGQQVARMAIQVFEAKGGVDGVTKMEPA